MDSEGKRDDPETMEWECGIYDKSKGIALAAGGGEDRSVRKQAEARCTRHDAGKIKHGQGKRGGEVRF